MQGGNDRRFVPGHARGNHAKGSGAMLLAVHHLDVVFVHELFQTAEQGQVVQPQTLRLETQIERLDAGGGEAVAAIVFAAQITDNGTKPGRIEIHLLVEQRVIPPVFMDQMQDIDHESELKAGQRVAMAASTWAGVILPPHSPSRSQAFLRQGEQGRSTCRRMCFSPRGPLRVASVTR